MSTVRPCRGGLAKASCSTVRACVRLASPRPSRRRDRREPRLRRRPQGLRAILREPRSNTRYPGSPPQFVRARLSPLWFQQRGGRLSKSQCARRISTGSHAHETRLPAHKGLYDLKARASIAKKETRRDTPEIISGEGRLVASTVLIGLFRPELRQRIRGELLARRRCTLLPGSAYSRSVISSPPSNGSVIVTRWFFGSAMNAK